MSQLSDSKVDIRAVLKERVVPSLRLRGFTGSFPHFRRTADSSVYLITFQLDKWGSGNFVVELAKAPHGPFSLPWGELVPSNKLTAQHINKRYRLGATSNGNDYWFQSQDFAADAAQASSQLLALLDSHGAHWWADA